MDQLFGMVDSSFKYILLGFNFITLIAVYFHKRNKKTKKQHNLLFVTAHPDDEAMFFRPTITSLTRDYFVHLLCLSGAGTARQKQLQQSAQYLGIHKFQCVSNEKLEDGMKVKWCQQTIYQLVSKYVQQNNIKALFTFDAHGISGHINHQAIYRSLTAHETFQVQVLETIQQSKEAQKEEQNQQRKESASQQPTVLKENKNLKIYYLQSTNILRKYTGFLEILIALLKDFSWINFNYFNAWSAMNFHSSQFTWYRKLWVIFSRYTYINTYQLRRVIFA